MEAIESRSEWKLVELSLADRAMGIIFYTFIFVCQIQANEASDFSISMRPSFAANIKIEKSRYISQT
jgi:hypothetical protein